MRSIRWIGVLALSVALSCPAASVGCAAPGAGPPAVESADLTGSSGAPSEKPSAATPATPPPPTAMVGLTLTRVDPASIVVGSAPSTPQLSLIGSGFAAGMQVSIGGNAPVAAQVVNPTTATVILSPANLAVPGNVPIAVVAGAQRSNALTLTVLAGSAPTLTRLSPISTQQTTRSSRGLTLTVSGTGFDATSVVTFNGTDVPTTLADARTLRGAIPSSLLQIPGQVTVSVRHGGTLSSILPFTILPNATTSQSCGAGTCEEFGLFPGDCMDTGDIEFGSIQCGGDGCADFVASCGVGDILGGLLGF